MPFAQPKYKDDESSIALRRLYHLLEEKHAKCQQYLSTLEAQEASLAREEFEKVEQQSISAESIVSSIYTLQKVIDPLEALCGAPPSFSETQEPESLYALVAQSYSKLDALYADIQRQGNKTRALLKEKMQHTQKELLLLKKPHTPKSVFASESSSAFIINIEI